MIDYEQLEDDLCTRLASDIYAVSPLPDNEAEFTKNFTKPKVYICCVGSVFGEPETNYLTVQNEKINFEAIIRSKTRRGASGIFSIIKFIAEKLQGFELFKGSDRITLDKHGYIEGVQNDWNYVLSFSIDTKCVAKQDDPTVENPQAGVYLLKDPEFTE